MATLAKALDLGRILVIEPERGGDLAAATATFDFSPEGYRTYVGELSGTCVTSTLNGCRPISMQRLLLAVRLMNHAVYATEPADGCSSTLITIVKDTNFRSRRNVQDAGFVPVSELPEWMAYEHRSWTGDEGGGWTYYMATDSTVRRAIEDLDAVGIFSGRRELRRDDRANGGEEAIDIRCALNDLVLGQSDLRAIASGNQGSGLSAPAKTLVR